jgi:hypothetical protein
MCRNMYGEIFVERKYDSNLVKSETRKRAVQTIISFIVNDCERQSIVFDFGVNKTCCIEARRSRGTTRGRVTVVEVKAAGTVRVISEGPNTLYRTPNGSKATSYSLYCEGHGVTKFICHI